MRVLLKTAPLILGLGFLLSEFGCSPSSDNEDGSSIVDEEEKTEEDMEDENEGTSRKGTNKEKNNEDKDDKSKEDVGTDADTDADSDSDVDSDSDSDSDTDTDSDGDNDSPVDSKDRSDRESGSASDGEDTQDTEETEVDVADLDKFSFFVTSYAVLRELSGSQLGFGGDLSFGETGPGAGLRGADKICATIAEKSMPGSSAKKWRAFLSATDDGEGNQVDAIDRIGDGPWYDRVGRLLAPTKADLLATRPQNGDETIKFDFPNEDGVPNHAPSGGTNWVDNHDMLTGTNAQGKLYSSDATCLDWTSNKGDIATEGKPRVGHSWPTVGGGRRPSSDGEGGSMNNWMSALTESGCAPGVNLVQEGGPKRDAVTVGSGGGYGGFYCFALVP